jgi:hypothetical protein
MKININFALPETKLSVVVWYRNGEKNEQLIPTPANMEQLQRVMLGYKVGVSEIRTIKGVKPTDLFGNGFNRINL